LTHTATPPLSPLSLHDALPISTLDPTVTPTPVLLNGAASASPNAADALSGVESASCESVETGSVGPHTVRCTATDRAGNTATAEDRKSTRLNSSHVKISYAVFC